MLVWGNYCNVLGGPVPVNIYYSTDGGQTVKIAYSFGRNPHFQEKGTELASFLGDPGNEVICRHVHSVVFNPAERAFYACTGDINRGHGNECHWLRGVYDALSDKWDWQVLVSVNSNSRYKSGGISFVDGQLYWAADANGPKPTNEKHDRGIFRCDPADLTDPQKHTVLFAAEFEMANMIIEDGVILAGHCAPASTFDTGIAISPDMGQTWAQYDLAEFGARDLPSASNRKTATAGSAWTCGRDGSSEVKCCSSNRRCEGAWRNSTTCTHPFDNTARCRARTALTLKNHGVNCRLQF